MRLTLVDRDGRSITFERHHRVGMPGETATTVKVGAGPVIRLNAEQEEQVRQFYTKPTR